jgi:hypothetical protein
MKDDVVNVCVQMDGPLVKALDARIAEMLKSGQETDRSKYIRGLLRRDLNGSVKEGR